MENDTLEFLADFGLFFAKAITLVIAVLILVAGVIALSSKQKKGPSGHIDVKNLTDEFKELVKDVKSVILDKEALKKETKAEKQKEKEEKQAKKAQAKSEQQTTGEAERQKRVYVLDFDGDIKASAVDSLREEITAVLSMAEPIDEVVIRLESAGGMVHSYGLAASQLARIKERGIPLTIAVDKVAASGGYMMACIADKIIAAPFAILGSIGVVAQVPNFHRLLKKNDIDVEVLTAGEYKRTLTMFGENTQKGRQKFLEDLEDTHVLFKEFVTEHRSVINMEEIGTGEVWFGRRAKDKQLIDEIKTSDEYILEQVHQSDVFHVSYELKKTLPEKLGLAANVAIDRLLLKWWDQINQTRFFH